MTSPLLKHNLVRPCAHCPFRNDIAPFLTPERAREIVRSLKHDKSFPCHETIDYDAEEMGEVARWAQQQCAGVMIIREKHNRPDQMMRIAERLGFYDRTKLDMLAPVFNTFRAFIAAQRQRGVTAIIERLSR